MADEVDCPATCCPELGITQGCTLGERLTDTKYMMKNLFIWENLVFLVLLFFFVFIARWTFQIKLWLALKSSGDFKFGEGFAKALTTDDNKALALSFAGYLFATGLILWSSLTGLGPDSGENIGLMVLYQVVGVVLLEVARLVNDKLLIRNLDNNVEIVKQHNIAVGAAEAGSYVGTGLAISASISGIPGVFGEDLAVTLMWFVLGQVGFIAFAALINTRLYAGFDFYDEMRKANAAAGVLYGLNLVAIGNLISNSIFKSDSLVVFFVWYALGGIVLLGARFLVDKLIIPSQTMQHEIEHDKNWGAALLIGGVPIGLTFILNTFLPDTCANDT